jgi:transposase
VSRKGTAKQFALNGKSAVAIVRRAVQYELRNRKRLAVPVIGIDEVSRRKGQVYLTVVYDLEHGVVLWVGDGSTEDPVETYFTEELGDRRCRTLGIICMYVWAAYANLVRPYAPRSP